MYELKFGIELQNKLNLSEIYDLLSRLYYLYFAIFVLETSYFKI